MRSRFSLRLLLAISSAFGAALVSSQARADWPEIQKRGTLKAIAVHEDLFFSLKPGFPPGFDREVLEGFAALHRLKLEPVPLATWDALIPSLLEGKGDLAVGGYAVTEERLKLVAFSSEVFPSRKVVFNRRPGPPLTTLEAFRKEKVGTVKGTSMAQAVAVAQVPAANLVFVPSGTLPDALRAGTITAAVLGIEHAILERKKDPEIQLGLFLGEPGSLAFALRKEDTQLQAALNAYLENFRKSPGWSRLVVKYLGEDAAEILKKAREK